MPQRDPRLLFLHSRYRWWFASAAIYNFVWGALNIFQPFALFDMLGIDRPNPAALWQVIGMFVYVYAPAYAWAACDPMRHRHLILIGLIGKVLGPIGFVWSALIGQLPLAFGWIIVTNDLIWWPAFFTFARDIFRLNGIRATLTGN
jgi:hypothetical protein